MKPISNEEVIARYTTCNLTPFLGRFSDVHILENYEGVILPQNVNIDGFLESVWFTSSTIELLWFVSCTHRKEVNEKFKTNRWLECAAAHISNYPENDLEYLLRMLVFFDVNIFSQIFYEKNYETLFYYA
jgi:hypothetical protein